MNVTPNLLCRNNIVGQGYVALCDRPFAHTGDHTFSLHEDREISTQGPTRYYASAACSCGAEFPGWGTTRGQAIDAAVFARRAHQRLMGYPPEAPPGGSPLDRPPLDRPTVLRPSEAPDGPERLLRPS